MNSCVIGIVSIVHDENVQLVWKVLVVVMVLL